jgi:hypothetical protein
MNIWKSLLLAGRFLATCSGAWAAQAPGALSSPDVPISHHDRVYAAEQFSNTVSVTDPVDNKLLGVIKLGDAQPANFSPLYKGQVLVHGLGYSPDHRTLALASLLLAKIGSAEDAPPLHKGPWPIRNGRNYQPTEHELRALHEEDVTPGQAREIDRLYDQLLASSEQVRNRHSAPKH